jgi:putative acetyltransferase
LEERGCSYVIVLGHPGFYPKFGFEPASKYELTCQWEGVPDEAFMVIAMEPSSLLGVKGVAKYRDEFNEAM